MPVGVPPFGLKGSQLLHSPASEITATWPFSATVSHTVTSAYSLLLVIAMPVGTLPSGSLTEARLLAVLLPAVPIRPLLKATSEVAQKPVRPPQRATATASPVTRPAFLYVVML